MRNSEKPIILILLPSFAGGGAERVVINQANALDSSRYRILLCVFSGQGPLRSLVSTKVGIIDLKTNRLRSSLMMLICVIRRYRPVVVVSTFGYVTLVLLLIRVVLPSQTRIVAREANLPSLSLPHTKWSWLMKFAYRYLYRSADSIVATSQRMADEFGSLYSVPAAKLVVLPNPVNTDQIELAITSHGEVGNIACPYMVASGRLVHQKGFDRLIAMWQKIDSNCRLIILGDGPNRAALHRQVIAADLSDRVEFLGYQQNPWRIYANANAFLMPSRWEGMPNAALEALACGTPVIATPQSGGLSEVADVATEGAIRIADFDNGFQELVCEAATGPRRTKSGTLLPSDYELANATRRFAEHLDLVVGQSLP